MIWILQLDPNHATECKVCKRKIAANNPYARATIDPDGLDEFGYDVCAKCRTTLPNPPQPL